MDPGTAPPTEGVPWTTAYAQRNPSVCTLRANQLTPKSEVTQESRQNCVLHAAPGSASGSSWFCIRLLLCFRRKQSYGIYQIRGKSSIRITDMAMPLPKHDWWTVSCIFIVEEQSYLVMFYEGRSAVTADCQLMGNFPLKPIFLQLD